eukprot:6439162-Amphidinium_carterae.1
MQRQITWLSSSQRCRQMAQSIQVSANQKALHTHSGSSLRRRRHDARFRTEYRVRVEDPGRVLVYSPSKTAFAPTTKGKVMRHVPH